MEVYWHAEALKEFENAAAHYERKVSGLGDEFIEEVNRTVEKIRTFPDAWAKISEQSRRSRTHRFPYGLVYRLYQDRIVILAAMHLRRKPGYWRHRED